ncbi:peptidoglycan DD-metalloendopeptidase family protein [Patescibacteria group bacterium]|nr:peptidoglycan DD-metalloendopeptidase family protein [Patescibacteria group bacterium]
MLRKLSTIILSLVLLTFTTGVFANNSPTEQATDVSTNQGGLIDDLNRNIKKQQELRNKIANAQAQEKSLANEISYLNNQIELTQLEIEEAKTRLKQLAGDIDEVSGKLNETKEDIDYTQSVTNLRLRTIYKVGYIGTIDTFLGSDSFNDYLIRQKYTEVVRAQDLELLDNLNALKEEFSSQKTTLEDKKAKEEALKRDLEQKEVDLANQEGSKQYLLGVTKNNEQTYQALLAQVQQEIAAIARLLGGGVKLGPVKRGDVIAFQGNTGCSTGSHLHFGLYLNPNNPFNPTNPKPYLDSGALRWPLNNPTVTQWFGNVWSSAIGPHTGIDMIEYNGAPIYAARDGVAYFSTDNGCPWLGSIITGTVPGKWIKIVHDNGWATIYGHFQ